MDIIRRILGKKYYVSINLTDEFKSLKGKTVVITGGSSGIGKEIARCVVRSSGNAIIIGRDLNLLKETVLELGHKCSYYLLDLANLGADEKIFDSIESIIGLKIDCLVNNAGMYIDFKEHEYTTREFDNIIDLNLKAQVFLTNMFLDYCKYNSTIPTIVFTSSNRSLFGDVGPYGISKCALNNYIFGLARELSGTGARVNGVAPGMTASNINKVNPNGDLFTSSARGGRVIRPEEIAEVVCFLLSDRSKCINGAIVPCDEGDYLR